MPDRGKGLPVRRLKAETGLYPFLLAYFTKNEPLQLPICAFHKELCAHLDWALNPTMHFRGAFPREHAKSTVGTKGLAMYAAASGKKKHILIIGANQREAENKLDSILDGFTWPEMIADYGAEILPAIDERKNRDQKNTTAEVRLSNGCYLVAAEAMGKLRGKLTRGKRPDLVILDDPEDDKRVKNPAWRSEFRDIFINKVLLSSLDSVMGSTVWLGTLLHEDSPLHHEIYPREEALKDFQRIRRLTYNAHDPDQLVGPDNETYARDGVPKVLWPQRWPYEKQMEHKRLIGSRAFYQEFMNDPRDPSNLIFRPEHWAYYDYGLLGSVGGRWGVRLQRGGEIKPFDRIVVAVDPAFTQNRGDYTALTCLGHLQEQERTYLIGLERYQVNPKGVVDKMAAFVEKWGPDFTSIEMIALQDVVLADDIEERVSCIVHKFRDRTKKNIRIETLAAPLESRRLWIPSQASYPAIAPFVNEAYQFPNGKNDDTLDSTSQGFSQIRTRRKHLVQSSDRRLALAGYTGGY